MGFFDLDSRERRSVDSGLNWIAGSWGAIVLVWLVATFHDHQHFWSVVSFITAFLAMWALVYVTAAVRSYVECGELGCRGIAPPAALSQELQDETEPCRHCGLVIGFEDDCPRCFKAFYESRSASGRRCIALPAARSQELEDETAWDRLVTDCEQRIGLVPAGDVYVTRHANGSASHE